MWVNIISCFTSWFKNNQLQMWISIWYGFWCRECIGSNYVPSNVHQYMRDEVYVKIFPLWFESKIWKLSEHSCRHRFSNQQATKHNQHINHRIILSQVLLIWSNNLSYIRYILKLVYKYTSQSLVQKYSCCNVTMHLSYLITAECQVGCIIQTYTTTSIPLQVQDSL